MAEQNGVRFSNRSVIWRDGCIIMDLSILAAMPGLLSSKSKQIGVSAQQIVVRIVSAGLSLGGIDGVLVPAWLLECPTEIESVGVAINLSEAIPTGIPYSSLHMFSFILAQLSELPIMRELVFKHILIHRREVSIYLKINHPSIQLFQEVKNELLSYPYPIESIAISNCFINHLILPDISQIVYRYTSLIRKYVPPVFSLFEAYSTTALTEHQLSLEGVQVLYEDWLQTLNCVNRRWRKRGFRLGLVVPDLLLLKLVVGYQKLQILAQLKSCLQTLEIIADGDYLAGTKQYP